jgi:plastocyanin
VHTAALHLVPILGAEKSKVPYYIAGGLLVAWALIVSLGLGLRRPDFPGNLAGQRAVMAITAVLVLATVTTAVITSGTPAKAGGAGASAHQSPGVAEAPGAPAPPASSATTAPPKPSPAAPAHPKASTGTPAPASSPAPAPQAAASSLKLAADPAGQLSYDTKLLSAKAGTVTITMTNASPVEHNVTIVAGSTILGATPTFVGGSKVLTLKLKPGTYTFYCSVPAHRQAGMEGTLKVS